MVRAICAKGLAGLLASFCFISAAEAQPTGKFQSDVVNIVTVKVDKNRTTILQLIGEGYDIAGVNVKDDTIDVITSDDVYGFALAMPGLEVISIRQIDSRLAPDRNYKTPAKVAELLQRYARDYPDLAHVESIGKSHQNRDIWALKISDNPKVHETKEPTILFNAMHHAREVMTTEVAIDTIEYLLQNYGTDPKVTGWVDNNEIWIVPMLNVDGNNKVWTANNMWRKNTFNGYGVDINRNYPYGWDTCNGSSGNTWSDSYRGPSPGSEPETQAIMSLVARTQPVFNISYHSYSELVLYPFGCKARRTPTRDVVEGLGKTMAKMLPSDSGRGNYAAGTPWELLYSADGGDIDWMYEAHHVIPYVIELNSSTLGFQPSYRYRQPTVEKLRPAWGMLLDRLAASGIRGQVQDAEGRLIPNAVLTVEALGQKPMSPIAWNVKNDGTYHVVLNPGMYRVSVHGGGKSATQDVAIGEERVDLDLVL